MVDGKINYVGKCIKYMFIPNYLRDSVSEKCEVYIVISEDHRGATSVRFVVNVIGHNLYLCLLLLFCKLEKFIYAHN